MEDAPRNSQLIFGWHVIWEVPIIVQYINSEFFPENCPWLEPTKCNCWPEESFSAFSYIPKT